MGTVCGIASCIELNCDDLRNLGGTLDKAWAFNIRTEFGTVTYTEANNTVSVITLPTYGGLYVIESSNDGIAVGDEVVDNEGGNKFYQHNAVIKTYTDTGERITFAQELLNAKVGIIAVTNNQKIFLFGQFNGMKQTEGSQNTGNGFSNDVTRSITLTGGERDLPKLVDNGFGFDATLAYLESLEIC